MQLRTVFFRSLGKGHSRRGAVQKARNIIGNPHLADALVGRIARPPPEGEWGAAKSGAKSRRPHIFGLKILESWTGLLKVDMIVSEFGEKRRHPP